MGMSPVALKLQGRLDDAKRLLKTAGIEEVTEDSAGKKKTGDNAAALQEGAVSGIVDATMSAEGKEQPGSASNVMDSSPTEATETTVAQTETNEDIDAAAVLNASKGDVVASDLPAVEKKASAIIANGQAILQELMVNGFGKRASAHDAMDASECLQKLADAGDPTAQHIIDFQASFMLGMQKKANDIAALVGDNPTAEAVAAAEDQLNEVAMEDPAAIMQDAEDIEQPEESEDMYDEYEDPMTELDLSEDEMAEIEELGAEIEEVAQETVEELADIILESDPEISEEEAYELAQNEVADALATSEIGQELGEIDPETGDYAIGDDEAMEAVDAMAKTASAHPLRDTLCAHLNDRIGLDPSAFAARLGF